MDHTIDHRPSYAQLAVDLEQDEQLRAEAGALVSHDAGISIETESTGGIFTSLKRSVLGGESFFQNTFTAEESAEVTLAPPLPGDVVCESIDGTLLVQSGSYLASTMDLSLDTSFGGAKTFFGSEGLFLLELEGIGDVFLSSYGAITEISLDAGEEYVVDTGHIVGFEDRADFTVTRVGGLKSTLFSGEGLVCRFTGPGRVWIQSRSQDALLSWLIPHLPKRESS